MAVTIDGDKVEGPTDDRGRLYLGSEYADQDVTVLVLETSEKDAESN